MKLIEFDTVARMEQAAFALLGEHFSLARAGPHAVMLTGGRTPMGLYRRIEHSPPSVDDRLHLLISDERLVPLDSPESNFGKMQAMVDALGIRDSRIMHVHTDLDLSAAAERYHQRLASYIDGGGRITLGILGLGADGHVASLFDADDIRRGIGRYAVAVPRQTGPDRVSVTRDLLLKVERFLFLVAGAQKAAVVQKMAAEPKNVTAAQAVGEVSSVELWFCPTEGPDASGPFNSRMPPGD